jgi:hypothetical protein
MSNRNYAVIESNVVTNIIAVDDNDAPTEAEGILFLQSLGFSNTKDCKRIESPTEGKIGDCFNSELGRFEDSLTLELPVIQRPIDVNNPELGVEDDPTKEWFYNDSGRWEVRNVHEES